MYGSWEEHLKKTRKPEAEPVVMPWLFSKPFRQEHPKKVKEIKSRFAGGYLSPNSKAFKRQMRANIATDTKNLLHRVKVPTLILVGKEDFLTPPRLAEELVSVMPNARLTVFDHGGHGLYWEAPESFNRTVIDFLHNQK